jgi:hypothetical protein
MARFKQVTFIALAFVFVSGAWTADAIAQRRHVVYGHGYYPAYYSWWTPYWSAWYGPWPYWWYGPYWNRPYYPYYYEPTGALRVEVSPRETKVYVDGYFVGIADDFDGIFQRLRVSAGGHEITLHLPGHRNALQKLYLQPGSTYHLKHRMEPLPAGTPEEAAPRPNPEAARPLERRDDERYRDEPEERVPEPRDPRLPPRPREADERTRESRFGSLAIRVQPSDAVVIVDGTEWRGAADDTGEILIQVAPGRHRIELRREGFQTFSTEVDVRPGVTTPVNVLLQSKEE